jgi:hypothetical protein
MNHTTVLQGKSTAGQACIYRAFAERWLTGQPVIAQWHEWFMEVAQIVDFDFFCGTLLADAALEPLPHDTRTMHGKIFETEN